MKEFKLIKKDIIAPDIFHMTFETSEKINMLPGQFVTFILPEIGGRAYSILVEDKYNTELIIKRLEKGRGGSKMICDLKLGAILKGVGPAGKFLIQQNNKNKLFIGTGTGFVPLYNQIIFSLNNNSSEKIKLLFGVRLKKDLFYIDKLEELKKNNPNFDFEIYLSRENSEIYNKGYVTNFIKNNNISDFEEFYICGMPGMVDSVSEELNNKRINKDNIFTEKY